MVILIEVLPKLQYPYRCAQTANAKNMLEVPTPPYQKYFPWCIVMIIFRRYCHRESTPSLETTNASPYMNSSPRISRKGKSATDAGRIFLPLSSLRARPDNKQARPDAAC
jgi:hypothetical protein